MPKIYSAAVDPTTGAIDPRHKITAAQVTDLFVMQSLYWNNADSSWYTQPAGGGTKVTARPSANRIDWIGAPATASISMMTSADLRMDAAS